MTHSDLRALRIVWPVSFHDGDEEEKVIFEGDLAENFPARQAPQRHITLAATLANKPIWCNGSIAIAVAQRLDGGIGVRLPGFEYEPSWTVIFPTFPAAYGFVRGKS